MSQRFEGRNLDDALNQATQTLGVERWQLTYHVLLEKRGFLGGVKRVVIEAEVNETAPAPAEPAPAPPPAYEPRDPRPPREERGGGGGGRRGGGGGGGRARGGGGGGDRDRGGRGGRSRGGPRRERGDDFQSGDFEQFLGDVPEQGAESEAATATREWCDRVVRLARLNVVARTEENDMQIIVRLYGSDTKLLVDRHGELLDAIQVLANKALGQRNVEKDIELDCEQFKDKRTSDLEQRAREAADRVRREGGEELLPAMTPIERRIVHLALHDDAEVTTESRGEGFYKRVAVVPRTAIAAPES